MQNHLVPIIPDSQNYVIAFSTKADGNMLRTNDSRVTVHNNRLGFLAKNRIEQENIFVIRTSHSPNVDVIDREPGLFLKKTFLQAPLIDTDFDHYYTGSDGALTFRDDLFIGLMSGDCVPVIIWDNVSGMHGILHVGLLGALNNMIGTLPRIFNNAAVEVSDTRYYLGPSITQRNYNVSTSGLWLAIADQARAKVPRVGDYIKNQGGEEYFDLQGMILNQLLAIGVAGSQVHGYQHCIADSDSIFFSHNILKQKGERGNFFSVIGTRKRSAG